jgi:rhamnose transport system permease protein
VGTVFGAFLGALLLDLLENSLFRWQVISEFWRDAILGMLILMAVAIDFVVFGRLKNLWARAGLQMTTTEEAPENPEVVTHVG